MTDIYKRIPMYDVKEHMPSHYISFVKNEKITWNSTASIKYNKSENADKVNFNWIRCTYVNMFITTWKITVRLAWCKLNIGILCSYEHADH